MCFKKQLQVISCVFYCLCFCLLVSCTPARKQYVNPVKPLVPATPSITTEALDLSRITHGPALEYKPKTNPDGSKVLFHVIDKTKANKTAGGSYSSYSIEMIQLGTPGRILLADSYANEPAWYPNGNEYIYTYLKNGTKNSIFVRSPVERQGMTFVSPVPFGEYDSSPVISPDGLKIAFDTHIGRTFNVCTVNSDGSNFTVYTNGFGPKWHPNGQILAFSRTLQSFPKNIIQIYTIDLLTGQISQLTFGEMANSNPEWSPDGNWLAFISDRDGRHHIYIMKRDGSRVTQLTKGGTGNVDPCWSSDGYIYFSSNAGTKSNFPHGAAWDYADIWRLKPNLDK